MRLNEGAGIRGLRGILPENDGVVRPWLEVARRDIRQWALAKGLSWCEDPTNGDTRFQRNSLRREGLPGLSEAFGQPWVHRAARSARNVLNMHRAWEVLLEPIYADAVTLHGRATYISSDAITGMDESVAAAVLDKALSDTVARLGGSRLSSHRGQVEAILKLFSRSGQGAQVAIGGGLVAHRDRSNVVLTTEDKPPDATADQRLLIEGFGEYQFGGWAISVLDGGRFTPSIEGACSSLEGSPFPWVARCAQEAELYHQLGGPGHRPILRLWMDAGLPKRARASTPVIAKDGKGLWAPLVRPSEEARAEPGDKIAKVIFRHREYLAEMP